MRVQRKCSAHEVYTCNTQALRMQLINQSMISLLQYLNKNQQYIMCLRELRITNKFETEEKKKKIKINLQGDQTKARI